MGGRAIEVPHWLQALSPARIAYPHTVHSVVTAAGATGFTLGATPFWSSSNRSTNLRAPGERATVYAQKARIPSPFSSSSVPIPA